MNIKNIVVVLFVCLAVAAPAYSYWGAPEECSPFGGQKHEVGLFVQSSSFESDSDAFDDSDVNEIQLFLQSSYPQSECWRSYIRINVIQMTASDMFVPVEPDASNDKFSAPGYGVTAGTQGTFWFYRDWSFGAFLQGSWYGGMTDENSRTGNTADLGAFSEEETISITSRYDLAGGLKAERLINLGRLYMGLALQKSMMKVDSEKEVVSINGTFEEKDSVNLSTALDASLYVGGQIEVYPGLFLMAEAQTGGRTSLGLSVNYLAF